MFLGRLRGTCQSLSGRHHHHALISLRILFFYQIYITACMLNCYLLLDFTTPSFVIALEACCPSGRAKELLQCSLYSALQWVLTGNWPQCRWFQPRLSLPGTPPQKSHIFNFIPHMKRYTLHSEIYNVQQTVQCL